MAAPSPHDLTAVLAVAATDFIGRGNKAEAPPKPTIKGDHADASQHSQLAHDHSAKAHEASNRAHDKTKGPKKL
jgi:hypothetical protein